MFQKVFMLLLLQTVTLCNNSNIYSMSFEVLYVRVRCVRIDKY